MSWRLSRRLTASHFSGVARMRSLCWRLPVSSAARSPVSSSTRTPYWWSPTESQFKLSRDMDPDPHYKFLMFWNPIQFHWSCWIRIQMTNHIQNTESWKPKHHEGLTGFFLIYDLGYRFSPFKPSGGGGGGRIRIRFV